MAKAPQRKKIDTGITALCEIIDSFGFAEVNHSCEGHDSSEIGDLFFGYDSPLYLNPIIGRGLRPTSLAYVEVTPFGPSHDLFELFFYLRDQTVRGEYAPEPSFKFDIGPRRTLRLELTPEFSCGIENGVVVDRVHRPREDVVMRLNFLINLCYEFKDGHRANSDKVSFDPTMFYPNLEYLSQFSPNTSKYPLFSDQESKSA